jgi:O-antigen/teichoic acid export membrane protein
VIAKESESLWVNGLLGNAAGGYYSLARYFISLLQIPISPLPNTTYPELTREAAKENWVEVKDILRKGTRLAAVYSVPVSLLLVVFGKLIIRLYSSVEFYPAYPILVILVVGYFIMNLFYWNRVGLLTLNRPVYPTVVNFVFMVVKITLMFALIPPMDTTFMAILFSGYLLFTTLFAVVRIYSDLNAKIVAKEQFLEGSLTE